jgi:hypothetical protein
VYRIRIGINADPDPAFCLNADADRQIHADPDTVQPLPLHLFSLYPQIFILFFNNEKICFNLVGT